MSETKKVKYRVRDMVTGLYQEGGVNRYVLHAEVKWSKKGKTWNKMSELKMHLKLLQESKIPISPLWEVVELESAGKEKECYPAVALAV